MEVSKDKFVAIFAKVMTDFKKLESELLAYEMTLAAFKQVNATQRAYGELFEQALEAARVDLMEFLYHGV